jgi:hypothetical protein
MMMHGLTNFKCKCSRNFVGKTERKGRNEYGQIGLVELVHLTVTNGGLF